MCWKYIIKVVLKATGSILKIYFSLKKKLQMLAICSFHNTYAASFMSFAFWYKKKKW